MQFQRYAIYYTAPPGPLADFGAAWLGWDVATGLPVRHPIIQGLKDNIAEITETPRKYGFHGTIKPPFRLTEGCTSHDLAISTKALCRELAPVTLDGLELAQLGRFLALVPKGDTTALADLAAAAVQTLDQFRAEPSDAELAKRRQANLSARQDANLVKWGYPYVMEDFRFHLTLTGKLEKKRAARVLQALAPALVNTLPKPFEINHMTLAGEDSAGRFHTIEQFELKG
ncbi:MAG: DUF1045 domain-containing protein [Cognatishimia sp.]